MYSMLTVKAMWQKGGKGDKNTGALTTPTFEPSTDTTYLYLSLGLEKKSITQLAKR